jgi:hypothetical protein
MRRTHLLLIGLFAALAMIAAACGSESDENPGADAQSESGADDEAPESSEVPEGSEFTYVATEFAFEGPQTLPAGDLTLTLDNQGEQNHEMAVFELLDGKTMDDVNALFEKGMPKGPPEWTREVGGTGAKPGTTGELEADMTAGNYVLLCFVSDKETKQPHVLHGMLMAVTVE